MDWKIHRFPYGCQIRYVFGSCSFANLGASPDTQHCQITSHLRCIIVQLSHLRMVLANYTFKQVYFFTANSRRSVKNQKISESCNSLNIRDRRNMVITYFIVLVEIYKISYVAFLPKYNIEGDTTIWNF